MKLLIKEKYTHTRIQKDSDSTTLHEIKLNFRVSNTELLGEPS